MDPLEKVRLDGPKNFTYISSLLSNEKRKQLRLMLLNNIDVFAWSHSYLIGINSIVASHKLNIIPMARPLRQKMRHFHPNRHQIIQTEVNNLLRAGFIREVKYPKWLANVVVVPKKWGKWRVVPATYHQMVNYLTNVGHVDLLSSQLATRQCYQLSAREQRGEKSSERHPLKDQTSA